METVSAFFAQIPGWAWGLAAAVLFFVVPRLFQRRREQERLGVRADLMTRLERSRGTRAFAIVHRDDRQTLPMRFSREYIERDTAEQLLSAIRTVKPEQALDIILHTPGGEVSAALQIAHALKAHKGRKTAFIPYHAFSAGTLIALTADEIVMGPHAVLGPIDPQIAGLPAAALLRLKAEKNVDRISDGYLVLADYAEKALEEARVHACDLVNDAHKQEGTCALTDNLVSGIRTHGYPITLAEAKATGINASAMMPDLVYELVDSYRDPNDAPAVFHRGAP